MSIKVKSYLKEVQALYDRILAFESAVNLKHTYNPVEAVHHYRGEDIRRVCDSLSKGLDVHPREMGDLEDAMHAGNINFMSLVQENKTMEDKEYQLLFIMSRPFFKSLKSAVNRDDMFWQEGRCPVCSAKPALSVIEREAQRKYVCSFCGTAGHYARIGCPGCLAEDPREITIITLEGEEGMRADTCGRCRSYVKTFEGAMTEGHSMDSLDIMSIPLDIIVQEKGFKRLAPNPVGMVRMQ